MIIPTYNRSWGLKRAIAGVLGQTFPHFELVITDDASTDDTPEVVRSFADPRIRYHRQFRNVGVARNWGTGVALARGEFLTLLMDDDRYEPEFLARRVAALRGDPAAILVFSGYRIVPEVEGRAARVFDPGYSGPGVVTGPALFHATLCKKVFVGATMYRAAAVRQVWSAAGEMAEVVDYALNLGLARLPGATGVYLGGNDFTMSEHAGQLSATRLALIFPLAEQLQRGLLADDSLPPAERDQVRNELCYWYLQWGKHEGWVAGRPSEAFALVCRALRLNPFVLSCWKLATRMAWAVLKDRVRRPGNGNSA